MPGVAGRCERVSHLIGFEDGVSVHRPARPSRVPVIQGDALFNVRMCVARFSANLKLLTHRRITYLPRGVSEENGMETMKIHVLERALTAACIVAAIAVVWWGFKILAA